MAGLPKSYIKKYGISKKAWSMYRRARGRVANPRRRRRRKNLARDRKAPKRFRKRKSPSRNYCRTYRRKRPTTGNRRGWVCNKSVTKSQARKSRARRNPRRRNPRRRYNMPKRNRYGRFVKSGRGRRRRRYSRRRNPVARRNPRRRNPRRRNPSVRGVVSEIRRNLTSVTMLKKLAVGATAAVVVDYAGDRIHAWINTKTAMIRSGWAFKIGGFVIRIGVGSVLAVFVRGYRTPILMGSGVSALSGLIREAAKSAGMKGLSGRGVGAWVTTGQLRRLGVSGAPMHPMGSNGMGGWLTTSDARRLGLGV